jgi:hypothetical protein
MNILATRPSEAPNSRSKRRKALVAVFQMLAGILILYALCTYGPLVIEAITQAGTSTMGIILLVGIGVSVCDVAGLLLLWLGLVRLHQSLSVVVVPIAPTEKL